MVLNILDDTSITVITDRPKSHQTEVSVSTMAESLIARVSSDYQTIL